MHFSLPALLGFVVALLLPFYVVFAAVIDPRTDIYALLEVTREVNAADLRTAYVKKVRALTATKYSFSAPTVSGEDSEENLSLLSAAYDILKDPVRRAQYDESRRLFSEGVVSEAENPRPDRPGAIIETSMGDRIFRTDQGLGYNLSKPIFYWRNHSQDNYLINSGLFGGDQTEHRVRPPRWRPRIGDLEPKWKRWQQRYENMDRADLNAIEAEIKMVNRRCNNFGNFEHEQQRLTDRAFLQWWFGLEISHRHVDMIQNQLDKATEEFAREIAHASLPYPEWRKVAWISELSIYPRTMHAVSIAVATPELMDLDFMIERLMTDREFNQSLYHDYLDELLPLPQSVKYGDRILRLIATHAENEVGPRAFLRSGGALDHWIRERPDVVDFAIRHLKSASALDEIVVNLVLTQKESVNHPEWFEYVLKAYTDEFNYMEGKLNKLLALDMWYHHPRLNDVLRGQPLTVAGLRRAEWRMSEGVIVASDRELAMRRLNEERKIVRLSVPHCIQLLIK